VLALVIVPLTAVATSLQQAKLYQASADVLLRYQSLPSTLSGISDPNSFSYYIDPTRSTSTQLEIATLPILGQRVAAALPQDHLSAGQVLGAVSVQSVPNTDVLRFSATSGSPALAARLATQYARQYTRYRQQLDTQSVTNALRDLQERTAALRAQGSISQANALRTKSDQLETLLSLETSNAVLVRKASGAAKIQPRPKRNAAIGLGLGLVLGIGLAFLMEALDTRLRSAEQIGVVLGLPLLARIPEPPKQFQRDDRLVMLGDSSSADAEVFRRLRMNLEFVSVGRPSQVIMVTSALGEEGKSTTIANLAVALARGGKRVALIDLDLRRPAVSRLFRLRDDDQQGLTAVVLGRLSLREALVAVPLGSSIQRSPELLDLGTSESSANDRNGKAAGSLYVLGSGMVPPDPGEFVALGGVGAVIAELREHFDIVLVDAPPILPVGDALTIGGFVDGTIVVVRAQQARRATTGELARNVARLPGAALGYVLCGADRLEGDSYYGYEGRPYARAERTEELVV
jgi:polysaccharide biosynthesis transport protein